VEHIVELNADIKRRWGERAGMEEAELDAAIAWLLARRDA
jgi:hypothetical protein